MLAKGNACPKGGGEERRIDHHGCLPGRNQHGAGELSSPPRPLYSRISSSNGAENMATIAVKSLHLVPARLQHPAAFVGRDRIIRSHHELRLASSPRGRADWRRDRPAGYYSVSVDCRSVHGTKLSSEVTIPAEVCVGGSFPLCRAAIAATPALARLLARARGRQGRLRRRLISSWPLFSRYNVQNQVRSYQEPLSGGCTAP
jgi:hypothetical protein